MRPPSFGVYATPRECTFSSGAVVVAAGALLLCAVAASAFRGTRSTSPRLEVAAGFASGVAGTVAFGAAATGARHAL